MSFGKILVACWMCLALNLANYNTARSQQLDSLEAIITGSTSIYKSKKNFYIQQGGDLTLLPARQESRQYVDGVPMIGYSYPYRQVLALKLSGCNNLQGFIKNMALNEHDLIRLMKKYYGCRNESPTYTEAKSSRNSARLSLVVGSQFTTPHIASEKDALDKTNFDLSTGFLIGFGYETLFVKSNFSFSARVCYAKLTITGGSDYWVGYTNIRNDVSASMSQLQA